MNLIAEVQLTPPASIPHIPAGMTGLNFLEIILRNVMLIFFFVGICLTVIYITWGGMQMAQSGGDKQKATAARNKITWAVIGLITLFLSYTIVGIVGFLFKVDLLRLTPLS